MIVSNLDGCLFLMKQFICRAIFYFDTHLSMFLSSCHLFSWMVSEWSKCSASCGSGWKQRWVSCRQLDARGEIKTLTAFACERMNRPTDTEQCTANNCPTWVTSPWGKVHASTISAMCACCTLENVENELSKLCIPLSVFRKVFRPHYYGSEKICHLPTCQWLLVLRL